MWPESPLTHLSPVSACPTATACYFIRIKSCRSVRDNGSNMPKLARNGLLDVARRLNELRCGEVLGGDDCEELSTACQLPATVTIVAGIAGASLLRLFKLRSETATHTFPGRSRRTLIRLSPVFTVKHLHFATLLPRVTEQVPFVTQKGIWPERHSLSHLLAAPT